MTAASRLLHAVPEAQACIYCGVGCTVASLIADGPGAFCCADTDACEARIVDQQAQPTASTLATAGPIVVADAMTFPVEAALARYVVFGKSGAGKTNTDAVLAEEFIRNGVPTVVIDVLGNMWGLRSSADGQEPGLAIPIIGGQFGDLPLDAGDAVPLAEILAEGRSAVLDLSLLHRDDQHAFVADFVGTLIQIVTIPMHVIIEEAERFVPARSNSKGHFAASVAVSEFARQCRNESIGWTMSTQRVDHFSHDVLNANSVLIALQNSDEDEQRAILAQVASRVGRAKARKLFTTFAGLKRGEAWFLPDAAWLGDDDAEAAPLRLRFRLRSTWDAAKPKRIGQSRALPSVRATVDLTPFDALAVREEAEDAEEEVVEYDAPASDDAPALVAATAQCLDVRRTIMLELLRRYPHQPWTPRALLAAICDAPSETAFADALRSLVGEGLLETRRGRGGGVALSARAIEGLDITPAVEATA